MNTAIQSIHRQLSISQKKDLSRESNSRLKWEDLDSKDRKIIMAVTMSESIEEARKGLNSSSGGFYKRWKYLKPVYAGFLNNFPKQAVEILKANSKGAAKALTESLEAPNPADRIKAANSILDRVTPERSEVQQGLKRKITLEVFVFDDYGK